MVHLPDPGLDPGASSNPTFRKVRESLTRMCSGAQRCVYCEDSVGDEVEHIEPKDLYPCLVFLWTNYVYACGRCNGGKSNKFAVVSGDRLGRPPRGRHSAARRPRGSAGTGRTGLPQSTCRGSARFSRSRSRRYLHGACPRRPARHRSRENRIHDRNAEAESRRATPSPRHRLCVLSRATPRICEQARSDRCRGAWWACRQPQDDAACHRLGRDEATALVSAGP